MISSPLTKISLLSGLLVAVSTLWVTIWSHSHFKDLRIEEAREIIKYEALLHTTSLENRIIVLKEDTLYLVNKYLEYINPESADMSLDDRN